jgi:hypothetical protein
MAQCSGCQFHNMPGATHCGRCGASMLLATAAINVFPPRAGKWIKAWRKTVPWRQWNYLKSQWTAVAERIHLEPGADLPGLNILWRLVVPGWPQQVNGNAFFGKCLFAAYFSCILLAALLIGTSFSSFLIATALTLHAVSIYDIAHRSTQSQGGRLSRFLLGCGVIGFFLYIPLYTRGSQYISPLVMQMDRGTFNEGEVLIANRRAYLTESPQIGDVVTYDIPETYLSMPGVRYLVRGERIDRILAGPNQQIRWENGTLFVDGIPSSLLPLNPRGVPDGFEMTVPGGHFLILPSGTALTGRGRDFAVPWKSWSAIPMQNIRGRVYWRSWPLSRMGRVR